MDIGAVSASEDRRGAVIHLDALAAVGVVAAAIGDLPGPRDERIARSMAVGDGADHDYGDVSATAGVKNRRRIKVPGGPANDAYARRASHLRRRPVHNRDGLA